MFRVCSDRRVPILDQSCFLVGRNLLVANYLVLSTRFLFPVAAQFELVFLWARGIREVSPPPRMTLPKN